MVRLAPQVQGHHHRPPPHRPQLRALTEAERPDPTPCGAPPQRGQPGRGRDGELPPEDERPVDPPAGQDQGSTVREEAVESAEPQEQVVATETEVDAEARGRTVRGRSLRLAHGGHRGFRRRARAGPDRRRRTRGRTSPRTPRRRIGESRSPQRCRVALCQMLGGAVAPPDGHEGPSGVTAATSPTPFVIEDATGGRSDRSTGRSGSGTRRHPLLGLSPSRALIHSREEPAAA